MRTIETIVDCHKMATERRKAGKPIWDGTVKIKHLFENLDSDSDTYEQDIAKAANKIAEIMESRFSDKFANPDDDGFSYEMMDIIVDMKGNEEFEQDEFNYCLNAIYDWCDYNRIWVE